jgi:hypothetical protein
MKLLVALIALLTLSACQLATEVQKASQKGVANSYSCEQITAMFSAYRLDKSSLTSLLEISKMTGLRLDQSAEGFAPSKYYETAKASANIALLVQGCTPLK